MLPVMGDVRPWADPTITSINRLPMAPPSPAFATVDEARAADPTDPVRSRNRISLDGRWSLRLFDHPDRVTAAAIRREPTGRHWKRVAVPGNWTLQNVVDQRGQADLPHYTNVQMPFPGPPPALPERNPTGVYRRSVTVPKRWSGRQLVLHVGGAESVHLLYVNGTFVGYGTDSRLASEYDVTDHLQPGRNEIAVVVVKFSALSYVEDQDQWWMGGLHREVYLEARHRTRLTSLRCDTAYDHETGTGSVDVVAAVGGPDRPRRGWSVRTHVETLRGRRIGARSTADVPHHLAPNRFTGHHATHAFSSRTFEPWSAESPTRYRVIAELLDPRGEVVEVHRQLIGFRTVEVRDRQFLVNGRPIWFFGVNRHDHHPDRGKAVTLDDMRADLLAMRRHNITAVRTAHYPNDPRLLDLADEIGLYVVDEANIESHAHNTSLCNDGRYRPAWTERTSRMVERDRNHPSIVMWSLGNESGYGLNHDAAAAWIRATDPGRPLHYEPAVFHDGWVDGGLGVTDVVCPMYPTIDDIAAYGNDDVGHRPLIMCEYSHAMGNANGSLADYWDVITTTPGLQGGFIWEWKDHGITTRLDNGRRGFAYGGQFGEAPHDGNFVADGLMSSDLRPHPAIQEVEWVYRPVTVELVDGNRLRVHNRRSFTGLDDLAARWEMTVAGEVIGSGALDVGEVAPGTSVSGPLPMPAPANRDAHLTVTWTQRRATDWAPKGHRVAWDQVELAPPAPIGAPLVDFSASTRVEATDHSNDAADAALRPRLTVFRAPTDNDGFKLMPWLAESLDIGGRALPLWQQHGVDEGPAERHVEHDHVVERIDDGVEIHHHRVRVPEHLDDLARIGVELTIPHGTLADGIERMRWYGRGPLENYPDRNRGAVLGEWEAPIDDMPYLVPQEYGLRTDCRWLELGTRRRTVLRIDVIDPESMHMSAVRHIDAALYAASHETDLHGSPSRRRGEPAYVVHLDVAHRGIGTGACGPDVLERYRIAPGEYRFSYRVTLGV